MDSQYLYFLISHSLANFIVGAYVVWVFENICDRVLSPILEKLFRVLEASLLLYLLLRIISVSLCDTPISWYHACWYSWYPCLFASGFATFCISWLLDKCTNIDKLPKLLKLLGLLNIAASLLVLTNDYHNLCFSFEPAGKELLSHNGPLIVPIKIFIAAQYATAFFRLVYLAYSSGYWRQKLWAPVLTSTALCIYNYCYTMGYAFFVVTEHVAINTFLISLLWQLCFRARIFPSYGYYTDLSNLSNPVLEAEAIYHVRRTLSTKMEQVLHLEDYRLQQALSALQSNSSSASSKQLVLHSLKLSLSFIKKHCLLYLQVETKGYIETEDFLAALNEGLQYSIEAGCYAALFPFANSHLSPKALYLHRAYNDILQSALIFKPEGLLFQLKQDPDLLQLCCIVPIKASAWLIDLGTEICTRHGLSCSHYHTDDGTFLILSPKEVQNE